MKIPKQSANLEQIMEFYLNSNAFRRLSSSTQRDYYGHSKAICETSVEGKLLGVYRCKNIKVRHLTQAYEEWLTSGVRAANYRKSVLSVAWRHAMRFDVFEHNPVSLVQTRTTEPRRQLWTEQQVSTFLDTAYSDFRWRSIGLIVHMAYDWGQRVGDMRLLTWDKLDLDQCRMDMTQSKRGAEVHLPIADSLCSMLRHQYNDFSFQEYVAPRVSARAGAYTPYDVSEIGILINEVLDEANLPRELTAQDLRRTAVTEMMEAGVSEGNIMQVTGHKNFASMKPYRVNTFSGASKALAARGRDNE